MTRLYTYSIRRPRTIQVIAAVFTLAMAPGILRLELRMDGQTLVPDGAPEVVIDRSIREAFGIEDAIIVVVTAPGEETIFNAHTLAMIRELTEAFQSINGLSKDAVVSLATERGDRVWPGTVDFRPHLDPLPTTKSELERLTNDIRETELYTGTLVSDDERAAAILVGVPADADRIQLYQALRKIIDDSGPFEEQIDLIGAPVAEVLLGCHILRDLGIPAAWLPIRMQDDPDSDTSNSPTFAKLRGRIREYVGMVPIAITVMGLVFWIAFRRVGAVLLPLVEVAACLLVVFGIMGWCNVPVYLPTAVLPVILTAIGVTDELHIFMRYREVCRAREHTDRVGAVTRTMDDLWRPVTITSITTAVGFLSFTLAPIVPVQMFGLFATIGILFCMIWSLTVVPAQLVLIDQRRLVAGMDRLRSRSSEPLRQLMTRLATACLRHRYAVLACAGVLLVAAPFGVARIVVQDSWVDAFAPSTGFHKATALFNERFLGAHLLYVRVEGEQTVLTGAIDAADVDHREVMLPADVTDLSWKGVDQWIRLRVTRDSDEDLGTHEWRAPIESVDVRDGRIVLTTPRSRGSIKLSLLGKSSGDVRFEILSFPLASPAVLHRLEDLERFIESHEDDEVGGVLGPAEYIATTSFLVRGRKAGTRRIPDSSETAERLWKHYRRVRGNTRAKQLIDSDYGSGVITVFLKSANYVSTKRLLEDIRSYERTHLAPMGLNVAFAGDVAVSQAMIRATVTTQIRSLLISIIGITLVAGIIGRSLGAGVQAVLPCALGILATFSVMGWAGIPLGIATSMFPGMTLGLGVDYAIHLLERSRAIRRKGVDSATAIVEATTAVGPAIALAALAITLGFGTLVYSQVPANARLGVLLVVGTISCLASTLILLPVLIAPPVRKLTGNSPLKKCGTGL